MLHTYSATHTHTHTRTSLHWQKAPEEQKRTDHTQANEMEKERTYKEAGQCFVKMFYGFLAWNSANVCRFPVLVDVFSCLSK